MTNYLSDGSGLYPEPKHLALNFKIKINQLIGHWSLGNWSFPKGFTLIELILSIALFAILAAGVAVPVIGSHLGYLENRKEMQANLALTETWEALRSIRNRDWALLTDETHGLRRNSGYWELEGASDETEGLTRMVTLGPAYRDPDGNLVENGGVPDADSKLVRIWLSWQPTPYKVRTIEANGLLTNYK